LGRGELRRPRCFGGHVIVITITIVITIVIVTIVISSSSRRHLLVAITQVCALPACLAAARRRRRALGVGRPCSLLPVRAASVLPTECQQLSDRRDYG
jgi:hypothetical protein